MFLGEVAIAFFELYRWLYTHAGVNPFSDTLGISSHVLLHYEDNPCASGMGYPPWNSSKHILKVRLLWPCQSFPGNQGQHGYLHATCPLCEVSGHEKHCLLEASFTSDHWSHFQPEESQLMLACTVKHLLHFSSPETPFCNTSAIYWYTTWFKTQMSTYLHFPPLPNLYTLKEELS